MDAEKLIGLGKELGLSGKALQQWIEKEREKESERYTLQREAAKEDHDRELERQARQRQLLELRLRVQESQQLRQAVTGEALTVVGRMSAEDATDFAKLKSTLLQRFRYTEEGYRFKF
ncbi:hypothetical protein HPB49_023331 [Dermacentor silvarum]|uniref:Uncharacterized protein n=1 Tax=Dermacentor silvarum TaxID=543639 RepID=A0ACB8D8T7_DERSI|nr:hypothetical protein HPB49_023331 [Dermacentor silvarum]